MSDHNPTLPQPLTYKFEPEGFYVVYSLWWIVFAAFYFGQAGSTFSIKMLEEFLQPKLGKLMNHIELGVVGEDSFPAPMRSRAVVGIRIHPPSKPTSDYLMFHLDLDRPKRECLTLQSPKAGPMPVDLYQLNFEEG